tara:strand:- start:901 stop:2691 length:1791 start_codon:yes stop_codon:yes gene_type:complete
MGKVTRKRLARGTKLTADHIQTPLASIAAELNSGTIEQEQLEANDGTFRVNLHIPYLASDFPFSEDNVVAGHLMQEFAAYCIPFTFPPTQEMWSATTAGYVLAENQPHFVLEEISFSFDQRGEPCAIKDQLKDDLTLEAIDVSGNMDFDLVDSYELAIGMVEKPQGYFGESSFAFQKQIFNAPLSFQLFQADTRRFNPLVVTGINAAISPFKTYAFTIRAPGLGHTGSKPANRKSQALVSVQISMKIRATLMERDVYASDNALQNWPTKDSHLVKRSRAAVGQSLSITSPAAGDAILADTGTASKAVSIAMGTVDDEYRHKLGGGIDKNCEAFSLQQLLHDASYEIISVPLMNNRRYGGIISRYVGTGTKEPYCPGVAGPIWDRRVVPIHYPMAIHHVVLAWNWNRFYAVGSTPKAATNVPSSNTFTVDVGVGMGEGLRSDGHNYQQISSLQIVNPANPHQPSTGWSGKMFDRCSANAQEHVSGGVNYQSNGAVRPAASTTGNFNWEWELHSVPLVGSGGSGYYAQGKPIFVGKSWSPTQARTNINGTFPYTGGRENFLEVRIKISDSAGFPVNDDVISGYQGHWVYIIGKKFLTR